MNSALLSFGVIFQNWCLDPEAYANEDLMGVVLSLKKIFSDDGVVY